MRSGRRGLAGVDVRHDPDARVLASWAMSAISYSSSLGLRGFRGSPGPRRQRVQVNDGSSAA